MRNRRPAAHESHDRWLVSYADFITLLFAFFVILFASTQTDRSKAKAVSEAIRDALSHRASTQRTNVVLGAPVGDKGQGNAMMRGPGGTQLTKPSAPPSPVSLLPSLSLLDSDLHEEVKDGKVDLKLESRGLIISLNAVAFFPSGDDAIRPSAYPIIAKVANVLNKVPNALRLEGHTDSIPIKTPRFRSNWELSAARSIAMLRLLNENFNVNRNRMAIVGYADTEALALGDTEENREKSRRVDIVIVSDAGMRGEPAAAQLLSRTAAALQNH